MQLFVSSRSLIIILLLALTSSVKAQETIQQQFDDFYENQTSNWQEYKLVKMPRLKNFWNIVSDTIRAKEGKISAARTEVQALNKQLTSLNGQLEETQAALESSELLNDSILFLGMQMSKSGYNTLVWLIIVGLVVGLVSLYLLYLSNNRTTRDARRNLAKIEAEYTAHQEKARESQTKLKRELQTALNTLQEHRIKI